MHRASVDLPHPDSPTMPSVSPRLTVKLRNGSDRLTLTQVTFSKGIVLRLGGGGDSVVLDQVYGGPRMSGPITRTPGCDTAASERSLL